MTTFFVVFKNRKEVMTFIGSEEAATFFKACFDWLTPLKPGQLPSYDVRSFILRILPNVSHDSLFQWRSLVDSCCLFFFLLFSFSPGGRGS
jgi:hypothetical protein